jgi:hypothetical protein
MHLFWVHEENHRNPSAEYDILRFRGENNDRVLYGNNAVWPFCVFPETSVITCTVPQPGRPRSTPRTLFFVQIIELGHSDNEAAMPATHPVFLI